jgi:peptidoglycan/xylan/chitin deacetylase (PgdA/CDA1 family)
MQKVTNQHKPPYVKVFVIGGIFLVLSIVAFFLSNSFAVQSDEVIVQYKSDFDPQSLITFCAYGDLDDIQIEGEVDPNKMGEYTLSYSRLLQKDSVIVTVADTQAPVVTAKDLEVDTTQSVAVEDFIESYSDVQDVSFSFEESPDLSKTGKQKLTILAEDASGNVCKSTVTLTRTEDQTGPEIEDLQESYTIKQGQSFELDLPSAKDDFDPNPQVEVDTSAVKSEVPGTYTIQVSATDRSGNVTTKQSQVVVEEDPTYGKKVVYLTFDDGPSYNTPEVLKILDKYGVKATFFVTGNGADYQENILKAYQAGHAIGLHTYTHDYAKVYASVDAYFNDLQKVSDLVESITGYKSDLIRFPGGSSNTVSANYTPGIMSQLVNLVQEKGYQYFDWNVSSSDASGTNVAVDKIISGAEAEGDQLVILFHDTFGKDTTVEALPTIIEYYQSKGYVFMPLTKDSYPAHHGVNN